jgi:hypothetical protein
MEENLLEKLVVTQLVKKFPAFYGTRRFIPVITDPTTGPYPQPNESSPYFPILFAQDPF